MEATHFVDTVAVMLRAAIVTRLSRGGAFLQILLVILEVVDWRRRTGHRLPSTGSNTLIFLQEGIRVEYLGHQQTRPSRRRQTSAVQVMAPRLPAESVRRILKVQS